MPSIHGEDAVLRVLDKETLSEKFQTSASMSWVSQAMRYGSFAGISGEPYGMVLVTRADRFGKDDDAVCGD